MARSHAMTARRRVALRKAQLASARKRHATGIRRTKNVMKYTAVGLGVVGAVAVGAARASNSNVAGKYKYSRTIGMTKRQSARRSYRPTSHGNVTRMSNPVW